MRFVNFFSLMFLCMNFCNVQKLVLGEFFVVKNVAPFADNEKNCESINQPVAIMETDEAYKEAVSKLKSYTDLTNPVWIGLTYNSTEKTFRWSDGTVSTRENWYEGEPDNLDTELCVSVFKDWDSYESILTKICTKNYHIICGTYDSPSTTTAPPPPPAPTATDITYGMFYDVTSSRIASGTELSTLVVPSKLTCGRLCSINSSCTHYKISITSSTCTLYSGSTSSGTTTSGILYVKI